MIGSIFGDTLSILADTAIMSGELATMAGTAATATGALGTSTTVSPTATTSGEVEIQTNHSSFNIGKGNIYNMDAARAYIEGLSPEKLAELLEKIGDLPLEEGPIVNTR